jgi:hypothetical protein
MAAFNKFNQFVKDLADKVHNLGSDSLKIMLTDVAPGRDEHGQGEHHRDRGRQRLYGRRQRRGLCLRRANQRHLQAYPVSRRIHGIAGGSIAQFRYAVLYNDTPTSPADPLIGWYDYGAEINVTNGNSFTVALDPTAGVFTLA